MNKLIGSPPEWKIPQGRWICPKCKGQGWSRDGAIPKEHARPDNRNCLAFSKGLKTELFYPYEHHRKKG